MQRRTLLCLLSIIYHASTDAFFIAQPKIHISRAATTMLALPENSWGFEEDDAFDVEAFRRRLESLVGSGGDIPPRPTSRPVRRKEFKVKPTASSPPLRIALPPAPPLTTLDRERRLVEQDYLAALQDSDEALTDLWDLWFQERGKEAADRLLAAEELTGAGPSHWPKAEQVLKDLMEEHGVYWVEPVNRLATLYYMQGRLEESETLCQMVLAVKPWHFGALSGIVMVYAGLHDSEKARQWAARRLPTFAPTGPNRRRMAWVETALQDSQLSLEEGEKRVREWMGPADYYSSFDSFQ
jgi:hypothetical protein